MKVEIRIGDISSNKRIKYKSEKLDNVLSEKEQMYNFIKNCDNCIIEDVDNFLL